LSAAPPQVSAASRQTAAAIRATVRAVADPHAVLGVAPADSALLVGGLREDGYRPLVSRLLDPPPDGRPPPAEAALAAELGRLRGAGAEYLVLPAEGEWGLAGPAAAELLAKACPLLAVTPACTVYGVCDTRTLATCEWADALLPEDCDVLVAGSGVSALLVLARRRAFHFPQGPDGGYGGHLMTEAGAALAQLERHRAAGADFLLVPAFAPSWVTLVPDFLPAVRAQYRELVARRHVGSVFSLQETPD
jgi:hypothetical protein